VQRYSQRLSGPLLDRIDLHVAVGRVDYASLRETQAGEPSAAVAARVALARERQRRRGALNAELAPADLADAVPLGPAAHRLLEQAAARFGLSARSCHRLLRVARTIADLEGAASPQPAHVGEAIGYRQPDRRPEIGVRPRI
jgi:magnesium chelatase family protein